MTAPKTSPELMRGIASLLEPDDATPPSPAALRTPPPPEPSLAEAARRVADLAPVAGVELAAWIAALHRALAAEVERDKLRRDAAQAMDEVALEWLAIAHPAAAAAVAAWAKMESSR